MESDRPMSNKLVKIFIQARLSSRRLPGKVLIPFQEKPIILHSITWAAQAIDLSNVVVLTSDRPSDDPLAVYVESLGISVFRGSLDNVFNRFQACLKQFPCQRFVRICADSPLLCPELIELAIAEAEQTDADLVTNVYQRTFPKGQSVEVLKSATFQQIDESQLSLDDREHVTPLYYRQPEAFKIVNMRSLNPQLRQFSCAIDTLEDLQRLEREPLAPDFCRQLTEQVVFEWVSA